MRSAFFVAVMVAAFTASAGVNALAEPVPQGIVVNPESSELAVEVWAEKAQYLSGERLQLHVRLSETAHVYLYNINAQGDITLLFPNAFEPDNLLNAGEHAFPDARYSLVVEGAPSVELIQAIATTEPVDILSLADQMPSQQVPFAVFSLSPAQLAAKVQFLIGATIAQDLWAAGWTQFDIISHPPNRWLIRTQQNDVELYLDGELIALTPEEITLAPPSRVGERRQIQLQLVKKGFVVGTVLIDMSVNARGELKVRTRHNNVSLDRRQQGALTVLDIGLQTPKVERNEDSIGFEIEDHTSEDINFRRLSPGSIGGSFSANLGGHPDGISTFGFEFGLGFFHFGLGLADNVDEVPEFFDLGHPIDLTDELVLNEEPEIEFYAKLSLPTGLGGLSLEFGGGFVHQVRAHIASPFGTARAMDVNILPNGYRKDSVSLAGIVGVSYRSNGLLLQFGYDTHRGIVGGLGLAF